MTDSLPILNYHTPPESQRDIPPAWLTRMRRGAILAIASLLLQAITRATFSPYRPIMPALLVLRFIGLATAWLLTTRSPSIPTSPIARWGARLLAIPLIPIQIGAVQIYVRLYASATQPAGASAAARSSTTYWSNLYDVLSYTYALLAVVYCICLYISLYQTLKVLGFLNLARQAFALAIVVGALTLIPYTFSLIFPFLGPAFVMNIQQLFLYTRYPTLFWQIIFFVLLTLKFRPRELA